MNSLLQTLFMTPEFRNALYQWKFDPSKEAELKEAAAPVAAGAAADKVLLDFYLPIDSVIEEEEEG